MKDSQNQMPSNVKVKIELIPVKEEIYDINTLATINLVHSELLQEAESLKNGYTLIVQPAGERSFDTLLLLVAWIATNKDLFVSCFNTLSAAIELVAKRDQVREVEIIVDEKTLILRDVNRRTAKELIQAFEAQYPETDMTLGPQSQLTVKAAVSKHRKR